MSSFLVLSLIALPAAPAWLKKIERVSPPPLDLEVPLASYALAISADGRSVALASDTSNRVRGDDNRRADVLAAERR